MLSGRDPPERRPLPLCPYPPAVRRRWEPQKASTGLALRGGRGPGRFF
jgi:hypothetical protein